MMKKKGEVERKVGRQGHLCRLSDPCLSRVGCKVDEEKGEEGERGEEKEDVLRQGNRDRSILLCGWL